jgi:hypothetical protein
VGAVYSGETGMEHHGLVSYTILALVTAFIFYPFIQSVFTITYLCTLPQVCEEYLDAYFEVILSLDFLVRMASGGALIFLIFYLRRNRFSQKRVNND